MCMLPKSTASLSKDCDQWSLMADLCNSCKSGLTLTESIHLNKMCALTLAAEFRNSWAILVQFKWSRLLTYSRQVFWEAYNPNSVALSLLPGLSLNAIFSKTEELFFSLVVWHKPKQVASSAYLDVLRIIVFIPSKNI